MPNPRTELFDQFARVGRVLGSRSRLLLLDLLSQGEKTVELLAAQAGLTVPNASNHLRELRAASLVRTRRAGQHVHYRLAGPSVRNLLRSLQDVSHGHLAEVRELVRDFYEDPDGLEPVDLETLRQRLARGEVVLLDVRPPDEYASGHIPGAVSVPLGDLEDRLCNLPRDREVVACCRGPYCLYSREAVERLRRRGYRAFRMEHGVADWEARGFPVEGVSP